MVDFESNDNEIDMMMQRLYGSPDGSTTTVDDTAERVMPREPIVEVEDYAPEYVEVPPVEQPDPAAYESLFDGNRRWPATVDTAPPVERQPHKNGRAIGGVVLSLALAGGMVGGVVYFKDRHNTVEQSTTVQPAVPKHTKHHKHNQSNEPSSSPTEGQTAPADPEQSPMVPFTMEDPSAGTSPGGSSSPETGYGEVSGKTATLKVFEGNVLGAAHTAKHGNKPQYAGATKRTHLFSRFLKENDVDFGAAQEFEKPQKRVFKKDSGDTYAFWPHTKKGREVVFWKKDLFKAVSKKTIKMPYFNGKPHKYPVVRLRYKGPESDAAQDIWVWSIHNPANLKRLHRSQKVYQAIATRVQKREVKRLHKKFGVPIFVLGDANNRKKYFCTMTENGILESALGGSNGRHEPCKEPKGITIDHILGSDVEFSNFEAHNGAWVQNMTDHKNVYTADATIKLSDSE